MKPWHALFAPLPPDAIPRRKPVASAELAATTDVSAIAGWDNLVVDLSDVPFGSRVVLVVVDADNRPISGSDHVLFRFRKQNRATPPCVCGRRASAAGSKPTAASTAHTGTSRG